MHSELFHRMQTLLIFEIGSFEGRLRQLLAEDYPTESAPSLIRQLISDLAAQRQRIRQILSDLDDDPDGAYERLRSEHRKLLAIYIPYVVYLQSSQTRKVPWSLVPSIERLSGYLLPGRKLLTSCLEEFNYRLIWEPNLNSGSVGIDAFDILLIPSAHRLNAFLHILIGHELFHPLLDHFLDEEQAQVSANLRSSCEELVAASLERNDPFFDERLDKVVERVRAIWRAGMEELICDLGCVRLFGPSAVLAFVAFILGAELDSVPAGQPFYPPNRYRLRTMLDHGFGASGHLQEFEDFLSILYSEPDLSEIHQAFENFWGVIRSLAVDTSDVAALESNPATKIAYAQIEEPLQRAWKFVSSVSLPKNVPWISSYAEVPKHLRSIRFDVPCGELRKDGNPCGKPSSISAVSLSAWVNEIYAQTTRGTAASSELYDDYFRAYRILLKSLERL